MPHKAPSICAHPNCGQLTRSTYCDSHKRSRQQRIKTKRKDNRPTFRQRGYSNRWSRASLEFRKQNPVCQYCGRAPAQCVDHVIPVPGGETHPLFWDRENWRAACFRCHNRKTAKYDRKKQ